MNHPKSSILYTSLDMTQAQEDQTHSGNDSDHLSSMSNSPKKHGSNNPSPEKGPLPVSSYYTDQENHVGVTSLYGHDNNSLEHELQHASDMSLSKSDGSSTVRVEIADIDGEDSINLTTTALRRCKRQILRPYWRLLAFIGWRGFGRESVNSASCRRQVLNTIYPVSIILLLIYTYVYEIVACQWKLDVKRDTQVVPLMTTVKPSTTPMSNGSSNGSSDILPDVIFPSYPMPSNSTPSPYRSEACEHIITTYVIPNFLHLMAYALGFYYFRVQDNEQLYAIMERVFLQATPLQGRVASQQKVIRKLRFFLMCGAFWILSTIGLQGLYIWSFNFPELAFFQKIGELWRWILFSVELLGILVLNSVNLAVVINYITQCEMIIFYVKGITLRLQEKSIDLRTAMKEIFRLRQNLSQLNGPIARMTSLVTVIFAELTIIGCSILILNENNSTKVWLYRSIFPIVWFVMLFFPLVQAARTNSICRRFKKLSLEARVFGYKNSSQLELDSFLLFVSNTSLRAKLFHIPILPSYLIAIMVIASFIILLLFQTSVLGSVNYLF